MIQFNSVHFFFVLARSIGMNNIFILFLFFFFFLFGWLIRISYIFALSFD